MKPIKYLVLLIGIAFATTHLGKVDLGRVDSPGQIPPASPENSNPTAYIDSIEPDPADSGTYVYFGGRGTDDDGTIAAYSWYSDVELGQISTSAAFDSAHLHIGSHTIWFKVQDNDGAWSDSVSEDLTITEQSPPSDSIGAEWWEGDPIGGGIGYSDIIDYTTLSNNHTSSWIVTAGGTPKDSLSDFLGSAGSGDTVYIMDSVSIDLTNTSSYNVPAGCILASGRGATMGDTTSYGAKIYIDRKDASESSVIDLAGKKARVTGLRIFGSYYELESGIPTSDSFDFNVPVEYGVYFGGDSTEMDNCEISGWGSGQWWIYYDQDSVFVHHNYIHTAHIYPGYGSTISHSSGGSGSFRFWANWLDDFKESQLQYGGGHCKDMEGIVHNNIFDYHEGMSHIRFHGGTGTSDGWVGALQIYQNTFRRTAQGEHTSGKCASAEQANSPDSVRAYLNWCYSPDSGDAWTLTSIDKLRISDNSYGTSYPDGLAQRIPNAVISTDQTSGEIPLTVKFKTTGSSDPDGTLEAAYWNFGDSLQSDNYDMYDDPANDSASHTYNQVGKYYAKLIVRDEYGCQDDEYVEITAEADDGKNYLSFWIKDWYNGASTGYVSKQCLLDNWICWEADMAGAGSWEHILVDVTDTLAVKDSITIAFRMYVEKDSSSMPEQAFIFVDDVWMDGAEVLNWNFESGNWSGGVYARTDDNWIGTEDATVGVFYATETSGDVHSGKVSYQCGRESSSMSAGDYSKVYQRVNVEQEVI